MPFLSVSGAGVCFNGKRDFLMIHPKRYMERRGFLSLPVVVLAAWMLTGGMGLAEERIEAKLFVFDELALPGERLKLKAFLFKEGLLGKKIGLGGEKIEFFVQNRLIGKSMTGGDGKAYFEFVPRLRGNLTIKARVRESPRVVDQEATGLLAAWEKRRPILIIDLPALVSEQTKSAPLESLIPFNLQEDSFPPPHADAGPELEKLGKYYYNLIYLYRSNEVAAEVVGAWVKEHGLPTGISMVVPTGSKALIAFLEKLKKDGWENVSAGIGKSPEFANIFVERRIKTVIIQDRETKEKFPRRANIVQGWKKVRRYL